MTFSLVGLNLAAFADQHYECYIVCGTMTNAFTDSCINCAYYVHVTPTHDTQYHSSLKNVFAIFAMFSSVGVSCGQPDIPSNGRVNTSAGTSFGDVARYSCDSGYTLNGPAERTCQADGRWSGSVPTCESEFGVQ